MRFDKVQSKYCRSGNMIKIATNYHQYSYNQNLQPYDQESKYHQNLPINIAKHHISINPGLHDFSNSGSYVLPLGWDEKVHSSKIF